MKFNPQKIGLPKRAKVTLQLQNPLALADLALHGSNDLRGWGKHSPGPESPLRPRIRSGDASIQVRRQSTLRLDAPATVVHDALPFVSLGLNIDIGMPRERQLLTQRLDVGRMSDGTKASADAMKTFGVSSIPNPMYLVLQRRTRCI